MGIREQFTKVVKSEMTSKTANIWMKGYPWLRISRTKSKVFGKYKVAPMKGEEFSVAAPSLKEY